MAGYKSGKISKVIKRPYTAVQTSELYASLMVWLDYPEPLNINTDSLYAERVVLHTETAGFISDNSELTLLFIQLQMDIRSRNHPLYITHIPSHTGLLGPLVQGHDETDQLLIGNVLLIMHFMKKNIILIGEV